MIKTIIVGAGPAGLTAGMYLKNCLILDQKKEIGLPVQCAEGLSKESLDRQGIEVDPNWVSATINSVQVIVPSGKAIEVSGEKMGFILDRPRFEKFLAEQCQARIQLETKVIDVQREDDVWKVKTSNGDIFESKHLIGADGPLSVVRRKVFPEEKVDVMPTLEYLVEVEREMSTSIMRMYFDNKKVKKGYLWIFPKSKRTANIGLGGKNRLDILFEDFMENVVKKEFGNYKLLENRSGAITLGGAKMKLFKDNALLIGDAGALADPIFGGGINNAMVSARLAAELILVDEAHLYEKKVKSMPFLSLDLYSAQNTLASFSNSALNQLAEVLEGKDLFYLKSIPGVVGLFSKSELRKKFISILRLLWILQKNAASFA
jgi:digeranylgeranylglycerophospholipid reductase